MIAFRYIADQPALADLCADLRGTAWLALDTEFIRESTYYPRLCLIQIASADHIACIDPLALPTLEPLLDRLYDPATTKILHSASQDLEIFFHWRGAVPAPIFDTQLAALALGQGNQTGYAALVQQLLGVDLAKTHTRADWRRRPLPSEWLAYAADDVRHLPELYQRQRAALEQRGWLAALAEDFAALADPARYRPQPLAVWQRVREQQRLRGVQRAALRQLAAWREEQAIACDRPRRWILDDAALIDLARRLPETLADLQHLPDLPAMTRHRHGETLLARIATARAEPPEYWPDPPGRPQLSPRQAAQVDDLLGQIEERACQYRISPQALADRRDVQNLLAGLDSPLRHGWRAAAMGREWLERAIER
ncbi:MAG: ribonuclease D [Candidatus Contendobacter sp.]|nr:ribonuclease D [Candidatus Contendobacter sp.]